MSDRPTWIATQWQKTYQARLDAGDDTMVAREVADARVEKIATEFDAEMTALRRRNNVQESEA